MDEHVGRVVELLEPSFDLDTLRLSETIVKRRATREFGGTEPNKQILSNLLYFSAGITDRDASLLAAPTARNCQEIDLYVAAGCGVYRYDRDRHVLVCVNTGDRRAETGQQDFVKDALFNFIYVFNAEKSATITDPCKRIFYSGTDSAFMASLTMLYATSVGLRSVVRAGFDKELIREVCVLPPADLPCLALSVG